MTTILLEDVLHCPDMRLTLELIGRMPATKSFFEEPCA